MITQNRSIRLVAFTLLALLPWTARAELADSAETVRPLTKGKEVPDVTIKTVDGRDFRLRTETAFQPTVIIFYRGGWCPYCNAHLADVQKVEQQLRSLGYHIVAISPDRADALRATAVKDNLTYTLLSDADMKATGAFGLAYRLDDVTIQKYKGFGIALTAQYQGQYWLPVPAVYIIGRDGRIGFAHWDPNYKVRLSGGELLKAAQETLRK